MTSRSRPRAIAGDPAHDPWKRSALREIDRSRRATLAFLSQIPEPEIVRPRTQDEWSINEVLAHLAAWEDEAAKRLVLIARGRGDRVHFFNDMAEAHRFNARAAAAGRRLGLADVRARLVRALEALPPESLRDRSQEYTVVEWLPELAWTHEQGHLEDLEAWRKSATPGRRL